MLFIAIDFVKKQHVFLCRIRKYSVQFFTICSLSRPEGTYRTVKYIAHRKVHIANSAGIYIAAKLLCSFALNAQCYILSADSACNV